jgi:hypothetical protein
MPEYALYYPEWTINDPAFLAESLLYWDRLGCMIPFPEFKPEPWHQDAEMRKVMQEAHEQFVTLSVPTAAQKQRAHARIKTFAELAPPEWCKLENVPLEHRTVFSAAKFAPETVTMLQEWGWARPVANRSSLELQAINDAASYLVIGALADACSSPNMPPVTDDHVSFAWNCNLQLQELGAPTGIAAKEGGPQHPTRIASDFAFLLARVPHLSLAPAQVNADVVRRVLNARRDSGINEQRQLFQKKVDEYLERLRTAEGLEREMVADDFGDKLKSDQDQLSRELRRMGLEAILSKEGVVAVLLGLATGVINPAIGLAIGLTSGIGAYHYKRQEAFNQHWSSWIFSATSNRLTVW